ncbi:MAG TPA: copper homeostasis protein CutC [Nocardioidaceae bacterium]|nr:copper homeostasis protein CutC [Nocardioidaceae bacterium]
MRERGLLEVIALHPADAEAAEAGGADRLELVGTMEHGGLSCETATVSAVTRATSLPVRVMLRLREGFGTTGGELARLVGLAGDYLAAGADGVVFGFLNGDLDVDVPVCEAVVDGLGGAPWTFHRALDHALDHDRAWRNLRELDGLDAVLTAGSSLGVAHGLDELTRRAADPVAARLLMAGGGLEAEHVPWLVRAGVRAFHVGSSVRPDRSWDKAYVDAGYVRSWRLLVDDHTARMSS